MRSKYLGLAAAAVGTLLAIGGITHLEAQTSALPQVQAIGPTDLFQDVVGGVPGTSNQYASASLFGMTFGAGSPSINNAIIGGDATTNLWQRGTAGSATTSATPTYNAPDRFAQWVPAAAAQITVSQDSTAADLPLGYQYAFKMAHTNTTAGQICIGQVVESVNSFQFQGQVAEFDFHAATGAGYTGGSTLTAYIYTGTVADEGMTAMAAGTWTGQATATAAVIPLNTVSTIGRFAAIASIASGAKEIGIAFCYTASTTDTNDYVAFSGIQLVRNPLAATLVNTAVGYNDALTTNLVATAFQRRPASLEASLQYRYFWQWNETASGEEAAPGFCTAFSATVAICMIPTPVTMRIDPVAAGTTCTHGTLKRHVAGAVTTISAMAAATTTTYATVSGRNALACTATVASGDTAGFSGGIVSGNSTGGGLISGNAEL